MSGPVLPVRRVLARFDRKADRFRPCKDSDTRGSLLLDLDTLGRPVMGVFGGSVFGATNLLGWELCHPSAMVDPAEFLKWMQANRLEILK